MYKIMLAEDEPEVLGAIIETIDWSSFSFLAPVGCRDGREAITKLEEGFQPDVLITDICMPFVDGLELTKYVTEHLHKTVVVVLSGYDEFTYAQKALQMQVYDYLLKPVTPDSIRELLGRLEKELDTRRLNDIEDSMQVLWGHFLQRLSEKRLENSQVEESCRRYKITFDGNCHLAAVLDADKALPDRQDGELSLELFRYALSNIAEDVASWEEGALAYQSRDGITRLLISGQDEVACLKTAASLAKRISELAQLHLGNTVSAGIGEPVVRPGDLYLSHRQAQEALCYRFFRGESSVLLYRDIRAQEEGSAGETDLSPFYRDLEAAVMQYDKAAAVTVLSHLFASLLESRYPLESCIFCCQRIMVILYHFADRFGSGQEGCTFEELWAQAALLDSVTIGQMEGKMRALCGWVLERFEPDQTDSAAIQVAKAEHYIHSRYDDPELSLQSITKHLAVSVSYFSSIFKSRTGHTFVEYLTKVRMDKAKQLLALSDRRTYETAAAVGFSDPHYFSVAFKRHTGMSPREFREYSRMVRRKGDCA